MTVASGASGELDSLYQEIILDHYKHPHHAGLREPFGAEVHHVNPTCGDEITLRVHLSGVGADAVVEDVSYDAEGCSWTPPNASLSVPRRSSVRSQYRHGIQTTIESFSWSAGSVPKRPRRRPRPRTVSSASDDCGRTRPSSVIPV